MKKNFLHYMLAAFVGGVVLMTSCAKDEDPPVAMEAKDVDASLLIGTWKNDNNANNFMKYTTALSGKTISGDNSYKDGKDWTIGETVETSNGTDVMFYYKVEGNRLTLQYPYDEMVAADTYTLRIYTLSVLTSTKLVFFEADNTLHSFTKQ